MGTQFGKTMELLFITANEIAYPSNAPANTPNRSPPQNQQKKYGIFSYKNITDNQGWLPIKIDYSKFKPKKYYVEASDEILQKHLQAIQKKQNLLKEFKYFEDFDRIDYQAQRQATTFQFLMEKSYVAHFVISLIFSRIFVVQIYPNYFSLTLWRNTFKKLYLFTFPFPYIATLVYQHSSPINHEYFRTMSPDIRNYEALTYDLDAYQHVNDMKYSYKYPEREDFQQVRSVFQKKKDQYQYSDAIKYYKRYYGIVDPDPYLQKKKDETKNTTQ